MLGSCVGPVRMAVDGAGWRMEANGERRRTRVVGVASLHANVQRLERFELAKLAIDRAAQFHPDIPSEQIGGLEELESVQES